MLNVTTWCSARTFAAILINQACLFFFFYFWEKCNYINPLNDEIHLFFTGGDDDDKDESGLDTEDELHRYAEEKRHGWCLSDM